MDQPRRQIAMAGTAIALTLAVSGLQNPVQAHEHTTGHQVGKVAVLAEYCGYGSRSKEIQSKFIDLLNFDDGYKYWQHYLVKYDFVHPRCGQVRDIADQLIGLDVRSLGGQQPKSVEKTTSENFDGKWVLEIAHVRDRSRKDRKVIDIKASKFSVRVSFDGWRGTVAGEIDGSGNLSGTAIVKKMKYGRRIEPYSTRYQEGEFHAETVGKGSWAPVFVIDMTRAGPGSEEACISTKCDDKEEQAASSLPDTQPDLQDSERAVQGTSIQSAKTQAAEVPDEKQVAALPETAAEFDGTWVLEVREPTYIPEASKVTVEIVEGRFTANVSKNGWRGEVAGEIDHSGTLVAWGYLRSLTNAEKALLKWSVEPSGSTYSATIPASTNWLTMTFDVSLYR